MVYKSIFKYYIMLTSFTDSSGFKLFVFAIPLLRSSSPMSVVNNRGWDCREGDFQEPGQQGLGFPSTAGKGASWNCLEVHP